MGKKMKKQASQNKICHTGCSFCQCEHGARAVNALVTMQRAFLLREIVSTNLFIYIYWGFTFWVFFVSNTYAKSVLWMQWTAQRNRGQTPRKTNLGCASFIKNIHFADKLSVIKVFKTRFYFMTFLKAYATCSLKQPRMNKRVLATNVLNEWNTLM